MKQDTKIDIKQDYVVHLELDLGIKARDELEAETLCKQYTDILMKVTFLSPAGTEMEAKTLRLTKPFIEWHPKI
jgi:hypothetical protein